MAIAFVGGTIGNNVVGAITNTVTYAATSGNVVCIFPNFPGTMGAMTVKDNLGTALTAGPTATNTSVITSFFYTAGSGVTSFVTSWTTSRAIALAVGEYSGVTNGVNAGLSGNSVIGTSTSVAIAVTTQDNNDWIVAGLGTGAQTLTITQGTEREQVTVNTARVTLADNTAATAGLVTVGGTILVSSLWTALALELRVTGGAAATAIHFNQLMMVGCGS